MEIKTLPEIESEYSLLLQDGLGATEGFNKNRLDKFNEWCKNPLAFQEQPGDTLNFVTSYIRYAAEVQCQIHSVNGGKEDARSWLPDDPTGLRRFCYLSCEAWWQRASDGAKEVPLSDQHIDVVNRVHGFTLLAHFIVSVGVGEEVHKYTSEANGRTWDSFVYCRHGCSLALEAVVEQWSEPADRSIASDLENETLFHEALESSETWPDLPTELQKRLLPVTPSVLRYAKFRLWRGATEVQAKDAEDGEPMADAYRGVLVRSFVVSTGRPIIYGRSPSDKRTWEVFTSFHYASRWVDSKSMDAAVGVGQVHREWIASFDSVFEKHGDGRGNNQRPKGRRNNDYAAALIDGLAPVVLDAVNTAWLATRKADAYTLDEHADVYTPEMKRKFAGNFCYRLATMIKNKINEK